MKENLEERIKKEEKFNINDYIVKPEDLIVKPRPRETPFERISRRRGVPLDTVIAVFKRSGNACEDCYCGPPEVRLTFHHLHYHYGIRGKEQPDDIDHLCWECHKQRHIDPNGEYWRDPEDMEDCWFGYHWALAKDD